MATAAERIRDHALGTVEWAREQFDLTYDEVGEALGVSDRTLLRWRTLDHMPRRRTLARIEQLQELKHLLETVFPTTEMAQQWMTEPNPELRGKTPLAYVRAGRAPKVVEMLASFEAGVYL
jgi:uncharacterized protein (DUF2384 family)